MAGYAKTGNFQLSDATVMLGGMNDLYKLNPTNHSIGLVKNFQMNTDPQFLDLTQGIQNDIVASVKTQHGVTASMEVYEYTFRNLSYAAGLDASSPTYDVSSQTLSLTDAVTASAATTATVTGDITTSLANGDYIFIQNGITDAVHIGKLTATPTFATGKTTLTFANHAVPTAMSYPVGSRVGKFRVVDVGGTNLQEYLAMKVVGLTPKDKRPFVLLFPKVKIQQGLAISFATDQWQNMPFTVQPYVCTADDIFAAEFNDKVVRMFSAV
jgi:hypothetical protein